MKSLTRVDSLHDNRYGLTENTADGAYELSDRLIDLLGPDAQAIRRWQSVFGPRLNAALLKKPAVAPAIYPQTIPEQLRYDQFLQISAIPCATWSVADRSQCTALHDNWPWRYIMRPRLMEVVTGTSAPASPFSTVDHSIHGQLRKTRGSTNSITPADVYRIFQSIHAAWSGSGLPSYTQEGLELSSKILCSGAARWRDDLIPLAFELEAYAAYECLLRALKPLASGLSGECWLDVGSVLLQNIRATELCQTARLYDELLSLCSRQIAPIIINEYGSVADGNHRLTAAWIANILSACVSCEWSLDSDEFQRSVCEFVSSGAGPVGAISRHEALRHLGLLLMTDAYKRNLIEKFQNQRSLTHINELPVAPIMEYSALAIVGSTFDNSGQVVRFPPSIYELLFREQHLVLPARACYHFADRVPLPWLSIAQEYVGSKPELVV